MIVHFLAAIVLTAILSLVGYFLTDHLAMQKYNPEDPLQTYGELYGLYQTILTPALLIPFAISVFSLLGYAIWVAPAVATASYAAELTILWLVGPIVGVFATSYFAVTRYWTDLLYDETSSIKIFARRMIKLCSGVAAIGAIAVLIHFSLQSLIYFIISLVIIVSLPFVHAFVAPRVEKWWSLRCYPIELTNYTIDAEAVPEIAEYDVYIEKSLSDDDDNAFAEGIAKGAFVTLREQIFEYDPPEREATLYHEIAHHKNNDILKNVIVTAVSVGTIYIVGLGSGSMIVSMFDVEKNILSVVMAGAIPMFGVIYISHVVRGWVSRRTEYAADNYAANEAGAEAMIEALDEEDESDQRIWSRLMNTHPSHEERVANLGIER